MEFWPLLLWQQILVSTEKQLSLISQCTQHDCIRLSSNFQGHALELVFVYLGSPSQFRKLAIQLIILLLCPTILNRNQLPPLKRISSSSEQMLLSMPTFEPLNRRRISSMIFGSQMASVYSCRDREEVNLLV